MKSETAVMDSSRQDRIDLSSIIDLSYWAKAIRISEAELRSVVNEVGPVLENVMREVILRDIRQKRIG